MRERLAKLYDSDMLMHTSFREIGSLSMDTILSQRKHKQKDVDQELIQRAINQKMMMLNRNESDDEEDEEEDTDSDQAKSSGYNTPVRRTNSDHFKDPSKEGKGSSVKKELKKLGGLLKKGVTNAKNAIKNVRSLKEVKPQSTTNPH